MKDIDFDELDKAVSSVLNLNKPEPAGATPSDDSTTITVTSKSAPQAVSEPEAVVAQAPSAASRPASIIPARRGRFMDVMHPGASPQPAAPAPTPTPAHIETKLEPVSPVVVPNAPSSSVDIDVAEEPTVDADTTAPSPIDRTSEPVAALDESSAMVGAEPVTVDSDLLDTATAPEASDSVNTDNLADSSTDGPTATSEDEIVDQELEQLAASEATASSLRDSVSESSPFLDTKVEKRPLGGNPTVDEVEIAETEASTAPGAAATHDTPASEPLPRELESDVVEVEALSGEQEQQTGISGPFATAVALAPDEQNDGRVEGHPLFDTSTYHEPMAASHRGSTPAWLKWFLGLLVCLLLGAGVGYFLFTAGL